MLSNTWNNSPCQKHFQNFSKKHQPRNISLLQSRTRPKFSHVAYTLPNQNLTYWKHPDMQTSVSNSWSDSVTAKSSWIRSKSGCHLTIQRTCLHASIRHKEIWPTAPAIFSIIKNLLCQASKSLTMSGMPQYFSKILLFQHAACLNRRHIIQRALTIMPKARCLRLRRIIALLQVSHRFLTASMIFTPSRLKIYSKIRAGHLINTTYPDPSCVTRHLHLQSRTVRPTY